MKNKISLILVVFILSSFALISQVSQNSETSKLEKPHSHKLEKGVCQICNGTGNNICKVCDGKQVEIFKNDCSNCKGNGNIDCPKCLGLKEIDCPKCNAGYVSKPCDWCSGKSQEEKKECKKCNGLEEVLTECEECIRGRIMDEYCSGNGFIDCPICYGEGKIEVSLPCNECKGAGYNKCVPCNGTGQVD